jgi:hypothetical protein
VVLNPWDTVGRLRFLQELTPEETSKRDFDKQMAGFGPYVSLLAWKA